VLHCGKPSLTLTAHVAALLRLATARHASVPSVLELHSSCLRARQPAAGLGRSQTCGKTALMTVTQAESSGPATQLQQQGLAANSLHVLTVYGISAGSAQQQPTAMLQVAVAGQCSNSSATPGQSPDGCCAKAVLHTAAAAAFCATHENYCFLYSGCLNSTVTVCRLQSNKHRYSRWSHIPDYA
jgi:hypothetical protein